jgi:hypothetical protein
VLPIKLGTSPIFGQSLTKANSNMNDRYWVFVHGEAKREFADRKEALTLFQKAVAANKTSNVWNVWGETIDGGGAIQIANFPHIEETNENS